MIQSCSQREEKKDNQTPEVLQDDISNNIRKLSYSKGGDILESIYEEVLNDNPELETWENNIRNLKDEKYQKEDKINQFDDKNHSYYSAAREKSNKILNKELKEIIDMEISKSESQYNQKIEKVRSLQNKIGELDLRINDYENAVKVLYTLPYIRNYQNNDAPNQEELKKTINEYEKLLKESDSYIVKGRSK
jgi:hypothetical protein